MSEHDYKGYREIGEKWLARIKAAEKREDTWLKSATAAEAAYAQDSDSREALYSFNILNSNVDTIVPAIYNSTPVPDIRDRFKSGDDVAKAVGDIFERVIATQIDDNRLDQEIEAAAQDAFLAGRGIVRVRFDADVDAPDDLAEDDAEPLEALEEPEARVSNEMISFEAVSWRDYREGPARRFEDVPWVAFRHSIPQEDLEDFRDAEMVRAQIDADLAIDDTENSDIEVWEVWDKDSRKVLFIKSSDGMVLKEEEDPLGLRGFFPISKPVQPMGLTGKRLPVCPFDIYKKLAKELDRISTRINAILSGLKVKGWITGNTEDVSRLADAGDNELVPISGFEGLAQTGGIDKAIVWWPIDKAIQVLRELYVARDQTKQAIYEITGISDIVRGASQAQETATAQQIKTQWGSLRIKKMQRLIERTVRDLFVMATEIVSSRFSTETIQQIAGLEVTQEMEMLLRDPLQRYRIDVESNSTIRADASRIKGELSEFLNGTANYFATMAPVIAQAPEAAGPVADIYASFGRLFNLGQQGEAAIEEMVDIAKQAGSKPRPNPEAEKLKAEMEVKQAEMQLKGQEVQIKGQEVAVKQGELALKGQELDLKREMAGAEFQLKAAEAQPAAAEQFDIGEQLAAHGQRIEAQIKMLAEAMSNMVTAPREIVRDEMGQPVGIRMMGMERKIVRGANGEIEGLE